MQPDTYQERYGVTISQEEFDEIFRHVKTTLLHGSQPDTRQLATVLTDTPYPLSFLYLEVIIPALLNISEEWKLGSRSFSQVVTAWSQARILVPLISSRRLADASLPKSAVLISCVEGNEHAFGTRMLADLLKEDGYQTILLDPPVQRTSIIDRCLAQTPACAGLSASMRDQFDELLATADDLRSSGYDGMITAGGYAIAQHELPDWRRHGIDWVGSDAMEFITWLDKQPFSAGIERKAA